MIDGTQSILPDLLDKRYRFVETHNGVLCPVTDTDLERVGVLMISCHTGHLTAADSSFSCCTISNEQHGIAARLSLSI